MYVVTICSAMPYTPGTVMCAPQNNVPYTECALFGASSCPAFYEKNRTNVVVFSGNNSDIGSYDAYDYALAGQQSNWTVGGDGSIMQHDIVGTERC